MEAIINPVNLVNITHDSCTVLKTVSLLGQKYGLNYTIHILKGLDAYGFRSPEHPLLETFGLFKYYHSDRIRNLIQYLLNHEYLRVTQAQYGSLGLTAKGEAFLKQPVDIYVQPKVLKTSKYDKMLQIELRKIRIALCQEEDKPPFRIFTDYTLQLIIEEKPTDISQLIMIPGIGDFKANRYGPAILTVVEKVLAHKKEGDRISLHKKAKSPAHQEVRALFEAGESVEKIAQKRSVKPTTVHRTLENLHKVGQINLRPWIEEQVDDHVLEKGAEYFRKDESAPLKQAYEKLGLDYETLRLCKLYVANHSSRLTGF